MLKRRNSPIFQVNGKRVTGEGGATPSVDRYDSLNKGTHVLQKHIQNTEPITNPFSYLCTCRLRTLLFIHFEL